MRGVAKWWIVVLLALNVCAWGSELLLGDGGGPAVVLAREDDAAEAVPLADPGLRAPTSGDRALVLELAAFADRRAAIESRVEHRAVPSSYFVWIAQLADDDVHGNATWALAQLAECDDRIVPLLEAALESPDRQQRQLAGGALRDRGVEPTEKLLEVTLEALRTDHDRNGGHRTSHRAQNSGHAALYLLQHVSAATDRLIANLSSEDPQQRFLSAYVLGRGRVLREVQRTSEVLVRHLHDNSVNGDACLGADALHALGRPARPYIVFAEGDADDQALDLLLLLQYDDAHRSDSAAGRLLRRERNPEAWHHYDPEMPQQPELLVPHNTPGCWETRDSGC